MSFSQRYVIFLGIIAGLCIVIIVFFFQGNNQHTGVSPSSQSGSNTINPLINKKELQQEQDAYRKKLQGFGKPVSTQPQYQFRYQFAPRLQNKQSLLPFVHQSYAASSCNTTSLGTVNVYKLKTHYPAAAAKIIAKDFSIGTDPASVPMSDGKSFSYYFSDAAVNLYLTLAEPSGTYYYHQASSSAATADVGNTQAGTIAYSLLTTHHLSDKAILDKASLDPVTDMYTFDYNRYYGYPLVDTAAINGAGTTASVCNIIPSTEMNSIEIYVRKTGELGKFINNTREVMASMSVPAESLKDAVKEYAYSLPVDPIVIGPPVANPKDTITLDEVTPVYYDYGNTYAQTGYVPMYLTSGKASNGSRILTLFPAVANDLLIKNHFYDETSNALTLQLSTFNPNPPPPPAPPGKLCFGKLVDYQITCTQNAVQVCSSFTSLPSDKNDPMNVCSSGCQSKDSRIDIKAGADPCLEFLKAQKLDTSQYTNYNFYTPRGGTTNFSGGTVVCKLQGCPC